MATFAFPPLPPDELKRREDENIALELQWLLESLQSTLVSLKEGLEECVALLAPHEPGSTLVLSSVRSEHVKGFVTRIGTKVVKGDISLRLATLPAPKTAPSFPAYRFNLSTQPTAPDLVLPQLISIRTLINNSLDIIDVSRWTGQSNDANFISGQLRLLQDNLTEAHLTLKGDGEHSGKKWYDGGSVDENIFNPPLPPTLSLHFSITDAALTLTTRTLEPLTPLSSSGTSTPTPTTSTIDTHTSLSISGFSLRERIFSGLMGVTGPKLPAHDETNETFHYRGLGEVKVKEKIRVESLDPNLISVMAKLSALEHEVGRLREGLRVLMGEDEE